MLGLLCLHIQPAHSKTSPTGLLVQTNSEAVMGVIVTQGALYLSTVPVTLGLPCLQL